MIPIDLSGKVALVTGVGDNESFAWFISKALQAAGAKIVLACHPRIVGIVEGLSAARRPTTSRPASCPTGPSSSRRRSSRATPATTRWTTCPRR